MNDNNIDSLIESYLNKKDNDSLALVIDKLIKSSLLSISVFGELNIIEYDNKRCFAYYTSSNHFRERIRVDVTEHSFLDVCGFELLDNNEIDGILINPYTHKLFLDKVIISKIIEIISAILVGDEIEEGI